MKEGNFVLSQFTLTYTHVSDTYVGLISFLLLSYSSYRSSDLTEMKGSMKSVQCSCGCEAILRTSTTKYNPGRLFDACPKKVNVNCMLTVDLDFDNLFLGLVT